MTHQFFMTSRCLYVLVADDRKQDTEFDYWFRIIHLLGRENQKECSPVLVVLNQRNHQSVTNFNLQKYRAAYPEMYIGVEEVDLSDDNPHRFQIVQQKIQYHLSHLPHIEDEIPKLWQPIRKALVERKKSDHHITWDDFQEICMAEGLKKTEDQVVLSRYLHRLGVIVHFHKDVNLRDFVILNPQWAVDAVYCILGDKRVADNKGKFYASDLDDYWREYSAAEKGKLLQLMLKNNFEVCYQIEGTDAYIAPQLLENIQPKYDWNSHTSLKFRFRYPFMPKGLISRLIVRLNEDIAHDSGGTALVWKEGVVIEEGKCRAQILQQKTLKEGLDVIDIEVNGSFKERKQVLWYIRQEVERIHEKSFENIPHSQLIPCVCPHCQQSAAPNFHEYATLLKYEEGGRQQIVCDKYQLEDVSVWELLEGALTRNELQRTRRRGRFGGGFTTSSKPKQKLDVLGEREPMSDSDKQELRQWVTDGKVLEVIAELEDLTLEGNLANELSLLQKRWVSNERERRKGIIAEADYKLERNQLVHVLLGYIGDW